MWSLMIVARYRERERRKSKRVQQVDEGAEYGLERRSVIAAGAIAGIVGPILFTVTFFVQGLFRLEEYDPVAEVVSALEAGPGGWVQQVNFMVFGLLTIAFVVGLHLGLRPTRWGFIGPSLLVLSGMALVWPQRSRCARTPPALPTTLVCTSWAA
jgi:hypothetical protein